MTPSPALFNEDLERVRRALLLPDTHPDQRRIAEIGIEFVATLLRKNSDYGSSAWSTPLLAPEMDVGAAIRVRMSDKIRRIEKLLSISRGETVVTGSTAPQVSDESIEDTMRDLGAYALLWLARPTSSTGSETLAEADYQSVMAGFQKRSDSEATVAQPVENPLPQFPKPIQWASTNPEHWHTFLCNVDDEIDFYLSRDRELITTSGDEVTYGMMEVANLEAWIDRGGDSRWLVALKRARAMGLIAHPVSAPSPIEPPVVITNDPVSPVRVRQSNRDRIGHCLFCGADSDLCRCGGDGR